MFCAHRVRGIGLYIYRILPPEVDVFVAPQVDDPINGRYLQAHPQEPPEVYIPRWISAFLSHSTVGKHPSRQAKLLCPTGGK